MNKNWMRIFLFATFTQTFSQMFNNENEILQLSKDPSYIIVASRILRPGSVYSLAVSLLETAPIASIRASISRDGTEVSSSENVFGPGDSERILLKIPTTRVPGSYKLRVVGVANDVLGATFNQSADLQMTSRFLTIIIHTNRPVYNALQKVRIRVMIFTLDMKPYGGSVNINILDPKGYVMTGFPSVQLNIGIASVSYEMAEYSAVGWWNVQVDAFGQVEYQKFLVEKFDPPKTEVFVFNSEFVLSNEPVLSGTLMALYWTNSFVGGNATIRLYSDDLGSPSESDNSLFLYEEVVEPFEGLYDFEYDLRKIHWNYHILIGKVIRLEVLVHDQILNLRTTGYGSFYVMKDNIRIKFLGTRSRTFKPGMPFFTYLVVSHGMAAHLTEDELERASITVTPSVVLFNGQLRQLEPIVGQFGTDGAFKVVVDTLPDTKLLILNATYYDGDSIANANLIAKSYYTSKNRSIYVKSSNSPAEIGHYCIFHITADFYLKSFYYTVISKGIIIASGIEQMELLFRPIKTISIPVSTEMIPSFRLLVYHVASDGDVIADSVEIPVKSINNGNLDFRAVDTKDKTGNQVELGVLGKPGGYVGFAVQDADTFCHKCGADLTPATVLTNLYDFEEDENKKLNRMKWIYSDLTPDSVVYYEMDSLAIDDFSTFEIAQMIVFTDGHLTKDPDGCDLNSGYIPCMNGQCYHRNFTCDGFRHCANGYDEMDCFAEMNWTALAEYRLFRKNRVAQFYDSSDGDWGWVGFNTDIKDFVKLSVPNRPSNWIIFAFRTDSNLGLSLLDIPMFYEGIKPFFINAEMPTYCKRGEQIGVRVDAFNNQPIGVFVTIHLLDSEDYRFVHVEEDGFVESYGPKTSSGEHQHIIWIERNSVMTVYMPMVATKVGEVEVTVEARTAIHKDTATFTLQVDPDGVSQFLHTSLLLDLKNQPQVLKFLNINVTESPIVPYSDRRLYLYDSPKAHISLVGDVFGPPFPSMPATLNDLLRKPEQTAEPVVFMFGTNLWMLHYLRLTNQLTKSVLGQSLVVLNYYYAYIMQFQNEDGSFSMWKGFEPSVWLTAAVVRVFEQSRFSDWENDLAVDVNILVEALDWLLEYQTAEGAFVELYDIPFNFRMQARSEPFISHPRYNNIPLTAFVLITLCEVNNIPGGIRVKLATARSRATRFLEKRIVALNDPYEVAIVSYALTLAGSVEGEVAFQKLDSMKREQEGCVFWSTVMSPPTDVYMDNQRPYLQAHRPFRDDALSVEATSYALLVYVAREGLLQENIVRWLNTMRTTDGGFVSTQDSLVAFEALTEFSFRARMRDITDMKIRITISSMGEFDESVSINEDNLATLQTVDISKVWGHVDVAARGSGMAVLQLDVSYSIDYEHLLIPPADRAFDLFLTAKYTGRNNSHIHINACQRWVHSRLAPTSGVAVFEMDLPTGYYQHQPVWDAFVESRFISNLRNLYVTQTKVYAIFRYLDEKYTCVNFTLERWWPVANLSHYNKAKVYDYYSPELYNETIFETYNLYAMDICQVCGSYQCPYCYYYSKAPILNCKRTLMYMMPMVLFIFFGHSINYSWTFIEALFLFSCIFIF